MMNTPEKAGKYLPCHGAYRYARPSASYRCSFRIFCTFPLKNYGLDGIVYRNAEPDFEVCAEAVVKIVGMTENRENYLNKDGTLVMGNFSQADMQLAEEWNRIKRDDHNDWTPRDVFNYRKANRLTWHEKCDTETMVLVRFEINLFFKHSGGCSECKMHELLDELDVIECFMEPGKAPIQGEVLKKQEQIYRDLEVTPLLAAPQIEGT